MIDLLLHDLLPAEQFGVVWNLMDEMETNGTTHNEELANNKYYIKATSAWVATKKAHRNQLMAP